MAGITLEKGKQVYSPGQPMTALHLITAGKVSVSYPGGSYLIGKGDVIGICETCLEVHFLSYTVEEDSSILTYPVASQENLDDLLEKHPDVARLFLMSAFKQIHTLLVRSSLSRVECGNLYQALLSDYTNYTSLCRRYRITPQVLDRIDNITDYLENEAADLWLDGFYLGLHHVYSDEKYRTLAGEANVASGLLRKCSLDYRKTFSVLEEQYQYRQSILLYYFRNDENDLFAYYTELYYQLGNSCEDLDAIYENINRIIQQFTEDDDFEDERIANRIRTFLNSKSRISVPTDNEDTEMTADIAAELSGSLNKILDYAGLDLEISPTFRENVLAYRALPDRNSMDDNATHLRKTLTEQFYVLYSVLFERSLKLADMPMPVKMFLYFGYVDEELAGTDNAARLYRLARHMNNHSDRGFYTFYDWLLAIYDGKKMPSRNEFEEDFQDYMRKQQMSGEFTDRELRALEKNPMSRVNYELRNMFPVVNKMTFGRISTFCPVFTSDNVLKDLDESLVTYTKVSRVIDQIRSIDYSAFYREGLDTEHAQAMGKELIHREYLPDIILMPGMGIRGVMWQEIEGKKRNSPARMFLAAFHMEALDATLIRLTGEFRWALCKRIQGARWNDVSERSLTSEYFDYVQFYRKNHDLTPEAKERIKNSLQRAKNSFKEMFIRDYVTWILFEGNGSPRLNKVSRQILFTYCPFPNNICKTLEQNPLYSDLLERRRIKTGQRMHHLEVLEQKLKNSKTPIPGTLYSEKQFTAGDLPS